MDPLSRRWPVPSVDERTRPSFEAVDKPIVHAALGPKVLDGGLATSLRARDIPDETPVTTWLDIRPEAVETAQRAFVDAGATGLLTATFRSLPHLDPAWEAHCAQAAHIALQAARGRAWVWGSLGPGGRRGESWAAASAAERATWVASWRAAARALGPLVHGLVLETFVDDAELLAALRAVKDERPDQAVVTSLVPTENGRLYSGEPVRHAAETLRLAGADIVGFNCGSSPLGVARAIRSCVGVGPLWAKPPAGPQLRPLLIEIAEHCDWIGGCCGVNYRDIVVLARSVAESRG